MPQCSVRHTSWRGFIRAVAAISTLAAAFLLHVSLAVAAPEIVLATSGYKVLDDALSTSFNVPEFARAASVSPDMSQQDWLSLVRIEQQRLVQILKGSGYLDGSVELVSGDGATASATRIELKPDTGPLYRIGSVEVAGIEDSGLTLLRTDVHSQMVNAVGKPARADVLSRLESEVLWRVKSASYPFAQVSGRDISSDPDTLLASVRLVIDKGPVAKFGVTNFSGLTRINSDELARLVPFSPGDPYSPVMQERLSQALNARPDVKSARVRMGDNLDADGRVAMYVEINERPRVPAQSAVSESLGTATIAFAVLALALRQVASAGVTQERLRRSIGLDIILFPLFAAAAVFIVLRLIEFAVPV